MKQLQLFKKNIYKMHVQKFFSFFGNILQMLYLVEIK